MAQLNVDTWALTKMRLDFADELLLATLYANAGDASGRGIDLTITDRGEVAELTGMHVYFVWHHTTANVSGTNEFTIDDATNGKCHIYYPAGMMAEGKVTARIAIDVDGETITGSRNFTIQVAANPVSDEDALASDDFAIFAQALLDLDFMAITNTEIDAICNQ